MAFKTREIRVAPFPSLRSLPLEGGTMRSALKILAVAFAFVIPALGQDSPAVNATASIHFYRYIDAPGPLYATIYCDGIRIGKVNHGHVLTMPIAVGSHLFAAGDKQAGDSVALEAGKDYYFRVEGGIYGHHTRLTLTEPTQGAFDIAKLKPL